MAAVKLVSMVTQDNKCHIREGEKSHSCGDQELGKVRSFLCTKLGSETLS